MKRTLKDWIIATRPWSLTASTMPVAVTTMYLYSVGEELGYRYNWLNAVLAFFMMAFFQAGSNLISDCYDHKQGVDQDDTLNGVTWIQKGLFTAEEIRRYGIVFITLCIVIGLVLLWSAGWGLIWIGVAGTLLAVCYPWLKFHAMGDYAIVLAFALLPSMGTSLVFVGGINVMAMVLSLTYGLVTVAILHSNNTRDIRNDRRAGIMTLAMQLGSDKSHGLYVAELVTPYIILIVCAVCGYLTWWVAIAAITIPVAIKNCKQMIGAEFEDAKSIATLDQQTAQLQLMLSTTLIIACLLSVFI